MTALKAHEVKRFLDRPDIKDGVFLAYGPDNGLVHETAMRLFSMLSKDAEAIVLDGDEVAKEPERLAIELNTISMFGGRRVVRVRGAGKAIAPLVKDIGPRLIEATLILESDNLLPKDALRAVVEGLRNGRALPCYADSNETIATLIKDTFVKNDIKLAPDVTPYLLDILGNDREITRRELEKLCLYAGTPGRLTRDDVVALCADNGMMAIDEIIDSSAGGDAAALEHAMLRARTHAVDGQRILIMTSNHFASLRRMRAQVDEGRSPVDVVEGAKPRPHFSRKNAIIAQLKAWTDDRLAQANERFLSATSESRRKPVLSEAIVSRALLAVCRMHPRP